MSDDTNFVPRLDGTGSLGRTDKRWNEVHAKTYHGEEINLSGNVHVDGTAYFGTENPEQHHQFIGTLKVDAAGTNNSELIVDGPNPNWILLKRNGNTAGKIATDGHRYTFYGNDQGFVGQFYDAGGVDRGVFDMAKSNSIISGTKHKLNISASVNALRVDTDESTNVFNVQGSQTSVVSLSASQNISASAFIGDGSQLTGISGGSSDMGGTMTAHIIPDSNAAYDLGNAEYKIRHLFLSDNSLWVGDEHKISIGADGKMKFRKRKDVLPKELRDRGVPAEPGASLKRIEELAAAHGLEFENLFQDGDDFDEENNEAALTALQEQVNALGASIPDVSGLATATDVTDLEDRIFINDDRSNILNTLTIEKETASNPFAPHLPGPTTQRVGIMEADPEAALHVTARNADLHGMIIDVGTAGFSDALRVRAKTHSDDVNPKWPTPHSNGNTIFLLRGDGHAELQGDFEVTGELSASGDLSVAGSINNEQYTELTNTVAGHDNYLSSLGANALSWRMDYDGEHTMMYDGEEIIVIPHKYHQSVVLGQHRADSQRHGVTVQHKSGIYDAGLYIRQSGYGGTRNFDTFAARHWLRPYAEQPKSNDPLDWDSSFGNTEKGTAGSDYEIYGTIGFSDRDYVNDYDIRYTNATIVAATSPVPRTQEGRWKSRDNLNFMVATKPTYGHDYEKVSRSVMKLWNDKGTGKVLIGEDWYTSAAGIAATAANGFQLDSDDTVLFVSGAAAFTDDIKTFGNVRAAAFIGDGSQLTGVSTFDGDYNSLTNTPDVSAMITAAVDGIVDNAPGTLDTLNEIASAIADDANIATTLTTAISTEQTRATAAEQDNATAISTEQARAEAAEQANATAISTEQARAEAAEQANASAITAEETRATAAEAALQSNIDSLGGLSIAEVYIHNTSGGTGATTKYALTTSYQKLSTNHEITFTAPANGKVKVKFIGMFSGIDSSVGSEPVGEEVYTRIKDTSSNSYIQDTAGVTWDGNKFMQTDESGNHTQLIEANVSGLTPGQSYTYEFQFKKGGNDTDVNLSFGADFAPTIIRAETLPSSLTTHTS